MEKKQTNKQLELRGSNIVIILHVEVLYILLISCYLNPNHQSMQFSAVFLVVAEQCLHRDRGFSHASHAALRVKKSRIADPNCPKQYSMPYDVTLNNKSWGKEG